MSAGAPVRATAHQSTEIRPAENTAGFLLGALEDDLGLRKSAGTFLNYENSIREVIAVGGWKEVSRIYLKHDPVDWVPAIRAAPDPGRYNEVAAGWQRVRKLTERIFRPQVVSCLYGWFSTPLYVV